MHRFSYASLHPMSSRATAAGDGDHWPAFFRSNTRDHIRFVAPARKLVHPVHLVVHAKTPERLHERHAFAIAIGHTRAEIDVRFFPGLLPDPAMGICDESTALVVFTGRERSHRFHECGFPFASAGFFMRAVE